MPTWVSLLRAVNLGNHNKLPMPGLRDCLQEKGFREVRTYLQSGNAVTVSGHRSAAAVAGAVHDAIAERFGLDLELVVRTPAQLRAVLDWNPFPEVAEQAPKRVFVTHLAGPPDPDKVAALLATEVAPDRVAVLGQEVVVCYDQSLHTSKVQGDWLARRVGVSGTARNWRTLAALVELSRG